MTRPARLLVSVVLAVVLALLAVPLAESFLPAVRDVLREPAPAAAPAIPKQQLPPEALSEPSTVTPLSAAAPLPAPEASRPCWRPNCTCPGTPCSCGAEATSQRARRHPSIPLRSAWVDKTGMGGPRFADAALAAAESATIGQQVQRMLHLADNYLAGALARVAASASGRPASFGGATETLLATVQGLGVPV